MSTTARAAPASRVAVDGAPRTVGTVARLTTRLVRRGTALVALGVAALLALEALSFEEAYPDAASRASLAMWGRDPGIRIIAGPATAVDTLGGFAVWDAGLYLVLILGAWAVTTTTRVVRGDEDAGRSEILLAAPIGPGRALMAQLAVLCAASLVVGATVAVALTTAGAQLEGALAFGSAMAAYCSVLVAVAAVASQVFGTRRSALAASGVTLAAWVLLRMVANSAPDREWLSWLTAPGWTDKVEAFGANRWQVLLVPMSVAIGLVSLATALRHGRESGAGILAERRRRATRPWGLGSPSAFAWRSNLGVLLAWAAGIGASGAVIGLLLPAVDDVLATDVGFQDILTAMGMNVDDLIRGFLGLWGVVLGLVIAVYTAFRMGAARTEEATTRVEMLLTRPLPRWRWLGGHIAGLLASTVLLCAAGATALWLGIVVADVRVSASDAFAAVFNTLPLIVLFGGLSVLVFGVAPRLTVPLGAAAAVVTYVVELVGPVLRWPEWVLSLSPFHHLETVPVEPFGLPAAAAMVAIGTVLAVLGVVAFERRDLVGA